MDLKEAQGLIDTDAVMIATLAKAVHENYGEEGLAVLRNTMEKTFRRIIANIAKHMGAKTQDGSINDWANVEKYIGGFLGMEGDFEITPTKGVMRVRNCPYAKQYQRTFPEVCSEVLIGCERAIAGTINDRMRVRGEKYITLGHGVCEIVCELEEK